MFNARFIKSRFNCDAPTRRAVIVGLGAGAPLLGMIAGKSGKFDRRGAAGVLRVGDLVDGLGRPTALMLARLGETVRLSGYFAPSLRESALFDLYEGATGPCLACGLIHDPGASLAVRGAASPEGVSMLARMELAGTLERDASGAPVLSI